MRWIALLACLFVAGAGAQAGERPILRLDSGGHMELIKGLAFTPDGKFIVSAGNDKVIRVWDWRAGKTVREITGQSGAGHEGKIFAMALSPDGRWLAAGGWMPRNEIRLYDFASGEIRTLLKGHKDVVNDLAFSPDGTKLVSTGGLGDLSAIVWDVEQGKILQQLKGHSAEIYAVSFTPDGDRVVTGSYDNTLKLWNVADGKLIADMTGHSNKVRSLAVSPGDGTIASGDRSGEIRLWDGKTGAFKKVFVSLDYTIGTLHFSPDGRLLLATCGYGGCSTRPQRIYEAASGKELIAYKEHDSIVIASSFSPDGTLVATGGGEQFPIQIWDPLTGETKATLKGSGRVTWAVGFSADGRSIGWGKTWKQENQAERGPIEMALRLPGAEVALGEPEPPASQEGWIRGQTTFGNLTLQHRKGGSRGFNSILDLLKDGKPSGVSIERDSTTGDDHRAYTFAPDGTQFISGGSWGVITAYNIEGKRLGDFVGHEGDIWALAVSPDGRYLLSGSNDQTVRLWNLKTRELLVTVFRGTDSEWVIWTPEGFYASSPGAEKIVGWQINQGAAKAARYVTAGQLRKVLHRPDLVSVKIAGDPDGLVKEAAASLNLDELMRQVLAPTVAILAPENGAQAKEFADGGELRVRVAIAARIEDRGSGIGKIIFKLNGQSVASAYGAGVLDKDGIINRAFDLSTPETTIEVVAEDKSGKVESLPASVTVHADPAALHGVPDLYVLAIGATKYHDARNRLPLAVSDAETLAKTLADAGLGYYRNAPVVKTLFDDEVTAEKVGAAFAELSRQVKANDVFVFYIAGHGKTLKAHGDYYFLPPYMDAFSEEEIEKQGFGPKQLSGWFETIPALKSIWIFDTCESGSAERLQAFRGRSVALDDAALQRLKEATGRTIFMASGEQQAAIEGYRNHGVFTYALLEGLAKAGSTDKVQLYELADYVMLRVPQLSRELKSCEVRGPQEYCQKPVVTIGHTPNYPLLPRYPKVLAMLGADGPQIATKATHAVLASADLFETATRGTPAKRQLQRGDLVTVISSEGGWAYIAQEGRALGYVEENALLPLRN